MSVRRSRDSEKNGLELGFSFDQAHTGLNNLDIPQPIVGLPSQQEPLSGVRSRKDAYFVGKAMVWQMLVL
jgi:hypothetical protein